MPAHLVFLGTGAAGGTPGSGESERRESSVVLHDEISILIDVTRDIALQARGLDRCDAVLLTHGHSDAIGGLRALADHIDRKSQPVPVYARPETIDAACRRFRRLEHCDFRAFVPGDRTRLGDWTVTRCDVPHAADQDRFPTVAWKLRSRGRILVYASDVARLTSRLHEFSRHASILVIDAATYRRRIFTHLRIDEDLPAVCQWPVDRLFLTQIGRSAPPHDELKTVVAHLCPRAVPAHDGLRIGLT